MKSKTVVFIHGMYMNGSSWGQWVAYFEAQGYRCVAPSWPGRDLPTHTLNQNHPNPQLGQLTLTHVVDHFAQIIEKLDEKPILIGHSMGGLVVQLLLQKGIAAAGVAISSAPPMGVFTTKFSFVKANWPHITPFVAQSSPIKLTFEQFQYRFVNEMPPAEQKMAYDTYAVPESRRVPREALFAKIDFKKPHVPLLFVAGSADNIIPASLNQSNYAKYKDPHSVTGFKEFPGRNHFIVGQKNWEEVAGYVTQWLKEKG